MAETVRVAEAAEIRVGQGKTVEVDGLEVAVFHLGQGQYCAVSGSCPHEGGPLGDGVVDRGRIFCPWHGFDFDPETGACGADPHLSVTVYQARLDGADLVVDLAEPPGKAGAGGRT